MFNRRGFNRLKFNIFIITALAPDQIVEIKSFVIPSNILSEFVEHNMCKSQSEYRNVETIISSSSLVIIRSNDETAKILKDTLDISKIKSSDFKVV